MKHSLFDIEETVEGTNKEKCEFALQLLSKGELKLCPLFVPKYKKFFAELLSLSNIELQNKFYHLLRPITIAETRLLYVYYIFSQGISDRPPGVKLKLTRSHMPQPMTKDYNLIFDESYVDFISNLNLNVMKDLINQRNLSSAYCPILYREFAIKTYDLRDTYYSSGRANITLVALYAKIALENNDIKYYKKLVKGDIFLEEYKKSIARGGSRLREDQIDETSKMASYEIGLYAPSKLWVKHVNATVFLHKIIEVFIPKNFLIYPVDQEKLNYIVELLLKYSQDNAFYGITCYGIMNIAENQGDFYPSLKEALVRNIRLCDEDFPLRKTYEQSLVAFQAMKSYQG